MLNSDLKVLSANPSFYDTFKVTPNETLGNFTDMKRISQEFSELISTVLLEIHQVLKRIEDLWYITGICNVDITHRGIDVR